MGHHTTFDTPNNASHIQRLPVEILELIMIACAFPPLSVQLTSIYSRAPTWINITHVCRHWRQVALQCPHLWTHIARSLSAFWLAAFLDHSGSQALAVEIDGSLITVPALERHLLAHISRVRHLHLDFSWNSDHQFVRDAVGVLTTPTPLLESLVIRNPTVDLGLEDHFFAGYAPRLRRLQLDHYMQPLPMFLLPNLTHLEIERTSTIEEMITTLRRTSLLETLSCGLYDSPSSETIHDIIHLPNLSDLWLRGTEVYYGFTYFFRRVRLPPTVHFKILLDNYTSRRTEEAKVMFDMLDSHPPPRSSVAPFTHLKIKIWGQQSPFFDGRLCSQRAFDRYEPQRPFLGPQDRYKYNFTYDLLPQAQLDFSGISPRSDRSLPMLAVRSIFDRIPLADVHTLDLSVDLSPMSADEDDKGESRAQAWDPLEWLPILRLMPRVRSLKLSQDAVVGVLRTLTPGRSDGSITPLWVCLSTLLVDSTFTDVFGERQSSSAVPGTLTEFLAQRSEAGLDHITCNVSPQA